MGGQPPFAVNAVLTFAKSSIGKKWIVAATGLAMFLFVIGHLAGNLQFFIGPDALNNYGQILHTWPELLWIVRIVLITCLVLHVVFTMIVVMENRRARPQKYEKSASVQARASTRFMAVSGVLLLGFIIFHLAHFTVQSVTPDFAGFHDEKGRHDVYRMVVVGFSSWAASIFYMVAMGLLCSHLSHGAWSWLQTIGLRTKKVAEPSTNGARILAVVLALGYISIPLAVLAGRGRGYVVEREHVAQAERQAQNPQPHITPESSAK